MKDTPQSERIHITILGRCNSGKSSLINAMTRQEMAIVSDIAGTTTDPVSKNMEIPGIGPCVLVDTAGFDDTSDLGEERLKKTQKILSKTDIAIMVYRSADISKELEWVRKLTGLHIPIIHIINITETSASTERIAKDIIESTGKYPLAINAKTGEQVEKLLQKIAGLKDEDQSSTITGNLVTSGDTVLLVMPQDPQAPKGRLILPQAQTIRELLDKGCIPIACTTERIESALASLASPPGLIITDSQVLPYVKRVAPESCRITTFSILFAGYKGDIKVFMEGAKAIKNLTSRSRILIAEACTHAPLSEDIGREKIPAMLRKRIGDALQIDVVGGADFPADLGSYDLVIHCGACMFNRKHVLARIKQAIKQEVPITNYGIAIAYLSGILDEVVYPG
ncbi:[FeFe] hydrogenase H-cluster maturation GTPase HydF [Bacteroides sp. 51]|uniref:[FeFe] hydrogenase H-cluster maturation GTPase HydF n=1 Tax=Bacteroides sp. 51 TaxID=2302938 RepID=UPI0013D18CA5|nr:[FeFe] hydrogenase H-cluster maturation GTPase HydF [Bacteroides sp. 51]NDV84861.1 [FeFe] hydrogenase H-cluster maturation GTPase HydF [Bacteroides sp. 51]